MKLRDDSNKFIKVCLFIFVLVHYAYITQDTGGGNPQSRLATLKSLYLRGTFQIDPYEHYTSDKVEYKGHFYSDKPPGFILITYPAFFIAASVVETYGIPLDSAKVA